MGEKMLGLLLFLVALIMLTASVFIYINKENTEYTTLLNLQRDQDVSIQAIEAKLNRIDKILDGQHAAINQVAEKQNAPKDLTNPIAVEIKGPVRFIRSVPPPKLPVQKSKKVK